MRALFSIAGLLIVLLVVMSLMNKQVGAVRPAAAPDASGAAPAHQAQRAAQDVQSALQQGAAARASGADR